MNKTELVNKIANNTGISKKQSRIIVNAYIEILKRQLVEKKSVKVSRFGRWYFKEMAPRRQYNIRTKCVELSKPRQVIYFKPYQALKDIFKKKGTPLIAVKIKDNSFIHGTFQSTHPGTYRPRNMTNGSSHQSRLSNTYIPTSLLQSGSRIESRPGLNLGSRSELPQNTNEEQELKYKGITTFHHVEIDVPENEKYPCLLIPVVGTPILQPYKSSYITEGLTEPILFNALQCIKEIEPEIEIHNNLSLPIQNRTYGYHPDIALIWEKKNIFIDIEIDEPYDIVSRKPIHYKGCSDHLRNAYFMNNGWSVIRVAEEQIVTDCSLMVETIKCFFGYLTYDSRFLSNPKIEGVSRWDYDKALELERNHYREKYLGIDNLEFPLYKTQDEELDGEYILENPSTIIFDKPDKDIFVDRFEETRKAIIEECNKAEFIIITLNSKAYDYVAYSKDIRFGFENLQYGICLYDIIEQKDIFVEFVRIESYHSTDNIVKRTIEGTNTQEWQKEIQDAILDSNPVEILYDTQGRGNPILRTVLYLTPWFLNIYNEENRNGHSDEELLAIGNNWKYLLSDRSNFTYITHFGGYCSYRKTLRVFSIMRIKSGTIYNCRKPYNIITTSDIWESLKGGYADFAERMYYLLSEFDKADLFNIGNYANSLAAQGKINEALTVFMSIDKDKPMFENKSWKDVCLDDINMFISEDLYKENFETILNRLRSKGW